MLECAGTFEVEAIEKAFEIINEVKYQMRNLVPVPNTDMVIQKSLHHLCLVGTLNRMSKCPK